MTSQNAIKVRAEDGRHVCNVDVSSFISNLPFGKETFSFGTMDASGSTSQAAGIVEVSVFLLCYLLYCNVYVLCYSKSYY